MLYLDDDDGGDDDDYDDDSDDDDDGDHHHNRHYHHNYEELTLTNRNAVFTNKLNISPMTETSNSKLWPINLDTPYWDLMLAACSHLRMPSSTLMAFTHETKASDANWSRNFRHNQLWNLNPPQISTLKQKNPSHIFTFHLF